MEVPTADERIQIARWSAIRDSCSQRVVALIRELSRAAQRQGGDAPFSRGQLPGAGTTARRAIAA
jgi:hypothetical protein